METPPSINRAVPYLFARDPSTKVVVSVSRDGSHYRAIGKGAALEMKLVPASAPRASALRRGTSEPPLGLGGSHRPLDCLRGGSLLLSPCADLSGFPQGKHLWDPPGYCYGSPGSANSCTHHRATGYSVWRRQERLPGTSLLTSLPALQQPGRAQPRACPELPPGRALREEAKGRRG